MYVYVYVYMQINRKPKYIKIFKRFFCDMLSAPTPPLHYASILQ